MDIGIGAFIVTGISAIAVIAIYLDRKWSRKRKLRIGIRYGFSTSNADRFIIVDVSNPGETSNTVQSISIGSGNDYIFVSPSEIIGYESLPLRLEPGQSHSFFYDYVVIHKSLIRNNQKTINALCRDGVGNKYESKKFKVIT